MAIQLLMDVAEPRLLREALIAGVDGSTPWDETVSTGYLVDPVTKTLMLRPLVLTYAYTSTFTGVYARLQKADYTLPTPTAWRENHRRGQGDVYLESTTVGETATVTAPQSANQAVYLSLYCPGVGTDKANILECGWGTPGAPSTVSLRLYSDGNCAVYKGQFVVGLYDLEGISSLTGGAGQNRTASLVDQTINLCMIPCRRRELLVLANKGAGFTHAFADLDPSIVNTITSAGTFWWRVPTGKASVQMSFCPRATAGDAYSPVFTFLYPPEAGRTFIPDLASDIDRLDGTSTAVASLVNPDLTPFVPDGAKAQARIKVHLTGDGSGSQFVYVVDMVSAPVTTTTNGSGAFDMTPYVKSLSLAVPEEGEATLRFTCKTPGRMQQEGLAQIVEVGDRPLALRIDDFSDTPIDLFRGTAAKPELSVARLSDLETLDWTASDRDLQLQLYSFVRARAYDGHSLAFAVQNLVETAGFAPGDVEVTDDSFLLPYSPGVSKGDFQVLPQRGDTPFSFLAKLRADYAATWITGWAPTAAGMRYRFRDPGSFGTAPALTIYESRDAALENGADSEYLYRQTVRSLTTRPESPEGNQVIIIGYDKGTRQYLRSQFDDAASQDPSAPPGSRPPNWRGQTVRVQVISPDFSTQETCDRARDIIAARLVYGRDIIEWESDLLMNAETGVPLWKGDVVRVVRADSTLRGDYRLLSLSCEFQYEGVVPVRRATYRGLKIVTPVNTGA